MSESVPGGITITGGGMATVSVGSEYEIAPPSVDNTSVPVIETKSLLPLSLLSMSVAENGMSNGLV